MDEQLRELERRIHDDEQSAMLFVQGLNRSEGRCEPYITRKIGELERLVKTILIAKAKLAGFPICTFERHGKQTKRPAFYVCTIEEPEDLDENYLFFTPDGLFELSIDFSNTNPDRLPYDQFDHELPCHQHYEKIQEAIQKRKGIVQFNTEKREY